LKDKIEIKKKKNRKRNRKRKTVPGLRTRCVSYAALLPRAALSGAHDLPIFMAGAVLIHEHNWIELLEFNASARVVWPR
jgi:hypothetical protein